MTSGVCWNEFKEEFIDKLVFTGAATIQAPID